MNQGMVLLRARKSSLAKHSRIKQYAFVSGRVCTPGDPLSVQTGDGRRLAERRRHVIARLGTPANVPL